MNLKTGSIICVYTAPMAFSGSLREMPSTRASKPLATIPPKRPITTASTSPSKISPARISTSKSLTTRTTVKASIRCYPAPKDQPEFLSRLIQVLDGMIFPSRYPGTTFTNGASPDAWKPAAPLTPTRSWEILRSHCGLDSCILILGSRLLPLDSPTLQLLLPLLLLTATSIQYPSQIIDLPQVVIQVAVKKCQVIRGAVFADDLKRVGFFEFCMICFL